jgi:hypothetical protein
MPRREKGGSTMIYQLRNRVAESRRYTQSISGHDATTTLID